jgi:hypothetical protein
MGKRKKDVFIGNHTIKVASKYADEIQKELDEFLIVCRLLEHKFEIGLYGEKRKEVVVSVEKNGQGYFCDMAFAVDKSVVVHDAIFDACMLKVEGSKGLYFDFVEKGYGDEIHHRSGGLAVKNSPKVVLEVIKHLKGIIK